MATIKSKFSVGQPVAVIKSGKAGVVTAIVSTKDGVFADVQTNSAKKPWRHAESALITQAEAGKAAAAKAKAVKAKPVAVAKPAAKKAAKPVAVAKPAPKKSAPAKKSK